MLRMGDSRIPPAPGHPPSEIQDIRIWVSSSGAIRASGAISHWEKVKRKFDFVCLAPARRASDWAWKARDLKGSGAASSSCATTTGTRKAGRRQEPRLEGGRHRRRQLRHRRGPHGHEAGRRRDDPLPAHARGHARRGRRNRSRRARGRQDRVPHRAARMSGRRDAPQVSSAYGRARDFDSSGRNAPWPSRARVHPSVDTVIAAIGQTPDLSFVPARAG